MKLTPEMLTGKSREHLINLPTPHSSNHFLQAEAMKAFQGIVNKVRSKMGLICNPRVAFVILNVNNSFGTVNLTVNARFMMMREIY